MTDTFIDPFASTGNNAVDAPIDAFNDPFGAQPTSQQGATPVAPTQGRVVPQGYLGGFTNQQQTPSTTGYSLADSASKVGQEQLRQGVVPQEEATAGDAVERGVLQLKRAAAGLFADDGSAIPKQPAETTREKIGAVLGLMTTDRPTLGETFDIPSLTDVVAGFWKGDEPVRGTAATLAKESIAKYDDALAKIPEKTWQNIDRNNPVELVQWAGHVALEEGATAAAGLLTALVTRRPELGAGLFNYTQALGEAQANQVSEYGEVVNPAMAEGIALINAFVGGKVDSQSAIRAKQQINEVGIKQRHNEAMARVNAVSNAPIDAELTGKSIKEAAGQTTEQATKNITKDKSNLVNPLAGSYKVDTGAKGTLQSLNEQGIAEAAESALQTAGIASLDEEGSLAPKEGESLVDYGKRVLSESAEAGALGYVAGAGLGLGTTATTAGVAQVSRPVQRAIQRRLDDTQGKFEPDVDAETTPQDIVTDASGSVISRQDVPTDESGVPVVPESEVVTIASDVSLTDTLVQSDAVPEAERQSLRDIQEVETQIRNSGQSNTFLKGANQYFTAARDAAAQGDTGRAQENIDRFNTFAQNHIRKAEAARALYNERVRSGTNESVPLTFTDTAGEQRVAGQLIERGTNRFITTNPDNPTRIHKGSGKLVRAMEQEADYLREVSPIVNQAAQSTPQPTSLDAALGTDTTPLSVAQPSTLESNPDTSYTQLDTNTAEVVTPSQTFTLKGVSTVQSQSTKSIRNNIQQVYGDVDTAAIGTTAEVTVRRPATQEDVDNRYATEVGEIVDVPDESTVLFTVGSNEDGTLQYVINTEAANVSPATLATAEKNMAAAANNNALRKDANGDAEKYEQNRQDVMNYINKQKGNKDSYARGKAFVRDMHKVWKGLPTPTKRAANSFDLFVRDSVNVNPANAPLSYQKQTNWVRQTIQNTPKFAREAKHAVGSTGQNLLRGKRNNIRRINRKFASLVSQPAGSGKQGYAELRAARTDRYNGKLLTELNDTIKQSEDYKRNLTNLAGDVAGYGTVLSSKPVKDAYLTMLNDGYSKGNAIQTVIMNNIKVGAKSDMRRAYTIASKGRDDEARRAVRSIDSMIPVMFHVSELTARGEDFKRILKDAEIPFTDRELDMMIANAGSISTPNTGGFFASDLSLLFVSDSQERGRILNNRPYFTDKPRITVTPALIAKWDNARRQLVSDGFVNTDPSTALYSFNDRMAEHSAWVEKFGGIGADGKLDKSKAYNDALKGISSKADQVALEDAMSNISGRHKELSSREKYLSIAEKPVLSLGLWMHYAYSGLASVVDVGTPIARAIQEGNLKSMGVSFLNTIPLAGGERLKAIKDIRNASGLLYNQAVQMAVTSTMQADANAPSNKTLDKINAGLFILNGNNFLGKLNRRLGVNLGTATIEGHLDTIANFQKRNPSEDVFNSTNEDVRSAIRHLGSLGIDSSKVFDAQGQPSGTVLDQVMASPYFNGKYGKPKGNFEVNNDRFTEAVASWSTQASGIASAADTSGLAAIPGAKVAAQGTATMYSMGSRIAGRLMREFVDTAVDAVKADKGANYEVTAADVLNHHGLPVSFAMTHILPQAIVALAFGAIQNAFNQPFRDPAEENEQYSGEFQDIATYTVEQYGVFGAYQKGMDASIALASIANQAGEFDAEYFENLPNYKKDLVGQVLGMPWDTFKKVGYSLQGGNLQNLAPFAYQLRQSTKKWNGSNDEPDIQDYFDFLADAGSEALTDNFVTGGVGVAYELIISNVTDMDEAMIENTLNSSDTPDTEQAFVDPFASSDAGFVDPFAK